MAFLKLLKQSKTALKRGPGGAKFGGILKTLLMPHRLLTNNPLTNAIREKVTPGFMKRGGWLNNLL